MCAVEVLQHMVVHVGTVMVVVGVMAVWSVGTGLRTLSDSRLKFVSFVFVVLGVAVRVRLLNIVPVVDLPCVPEAANVRRWRGRS